MNKLVELLQYQCGLKERYIHTVYDNYWAVLVHMPQFFDHLNDFIYLEKGVTPVSY